MGVSTTGAVKDDFISVNGGNNTVKSTKGKYTINIEGLANFSSLSFERKGKDLIVKYGSGTDSVRLVDYWKNSSQYSYKNIKIGGTSQTIKSLLSSKSLYQDFSNAGASTIPGSAYNDVIIGSKNNDKIRGEKGNDTITGGKGSDKLYGVRGNNTFVFNSGDGRDKVYKGKGSDTLWFKDAKIANIGLAASGKNLVVRALNDSGAVINEVELIGALKNYSTHSVKTIKASNGTITLANLVAKSPILFDFSKSGNKISTKGSNYKDNIIGSSKNDTIRGGKGNDTITGGKGKDKLYGVEGNNTFVFNKGDGYDLVYKGKGSDTLKFNDAKLENIELVSLKKKSLLIRVYDDTKTKVINEVELVDYLKKGHSVNKIMGKDGTLSVAKLSEMNKIVFDNSSSNKKVNFTGTANGDKIIGSAKNDTIHGGNGADVIIGGKGDDRLYGDGGDDIYEFNSGDGHDYVYSGAGSDTIKFNQAVKENISVTKNGKNLLLTVKDSAGKVLNQVELVNYLSNPLTQSVKAIVDKNGNSVYGSDLFDYNFGGNKSSANFAGTMLSDKVTGSIYDDTISSGAGDDVITAGKGSDTININGQGTKTLTFSKGDGDDVMTIIDDKNVNVNMSFTGECSFSSERVDNDAVVKRIYSDNSVETVTIKNFWVDEENTISSTVRINGKNLVDILYITEVGAEDAPNEFIHDDDKNYEIIGGNSTDTVKLGNGDNIVVTKAGDDDITLGGGDNEITIDGDGKKTINYILSNMGKNKVAVVDSDADVRVVIKDDDGDGNMVEVPSDSFKYVRDGNDLVVVLDNGFMSLIGEVMRFKDYFLTDANRDVYINDDVLSVKDINVTADGETLLDGSFKYLLTSGEDNDTITIDGSVVDFTLTEGSGDDTIQFTAGSDISINLNNDDADISYGRTIDDLIVIRTYTEVNSLGETVETKETTTIKDFWNLPSATITLNKNDEIIDLLEDETILVKASGNLSLTDGYDYYVVGSEGNDTIELGNGKNTVVEKGGDGNSLTTGTNDDSFVIEGGSSTITSGAGNDTITMKGGEVIVADSSSDDTIVFDSGENTFVSSIGGESYSVNGGTNDITSGKASDTYTVTGGTNVIDAGAGTDIFNLNGGDNTIDASGYLGVEATVRYTSSADAISLFRGGKFDYVKGVNITDGTNDITTGDSKDLFVISGGTNTIDAGDGAAHLVLSGGDNTIELGDSQNTFDIDDGTNDITINDGYALGYINGGENTIVNKKGSSSDPLDISSYIVLNGGKNDITMNDYADQFIINNGDNTINAGNGTAVYLIYNGNNNITGGNNWERSEIRGGTNTLDLGRGGCRVEIYNGTNTILGSSENTRPSDYTNPEDGYYPGTYGANNDRILVYGGTNTIQTKADDDELEIYSGDNTIIINNGDGNDSVAISGSAKANIVFDTDVLRFTRADGGKRTETNGSSTAIDDLVVTRVYYKKDEDGNLVLDGEGNPIVLNTEDTTLINYWTSSCSKNITINDKSVEDLLQSTVINVACKSGSGTVDINTKDGYNYNLSFTDYDKIERVGDNLVVSRGSYIKTTLKDFFADGANQNVLLNGNAISAQDVTYIAVDGLSLDATDSIKYDVMFLASADKTYTRDGDNLKVTADGKTVTFSNYWSGNTVTAKINSSDINTLLGASDTLVNLSVSGSFDGETDDYNYNITGSDGADTIYGNSSLTIANGGAGDDTYYTSSVSNKMVINDASGSDDKLVLDKNIYSTENTDGYFAFFDVVYNDLTGNYEAVDNLYLINSDFMSQFETNLSDASNPFAAFETTLGAGTSDGIGHEIIGYFGDGCVESIKGKTDGYTIDKTLVQDVAQAVGSWLSTQSALPENDGLDFSSASNALKSLQLNSSEVTELMNVYRDNINPPAP